MNQFNEHHNFYFDLLITVGVELELLGDFLIIVFFFWLSSNFISMSVVILSNSHLQNKVIKVKKMISYLPPGHFIRKYLLYFYCFGIYVKSPFEKPKRCHTQILSNISRIVHMICVVTTIFLFYRDVLYRTEGQLFNIALIISFIPNMILILCANSRAKQVNTILSATFHAEKHLNKIIDKKSECLKILQRKLHMNFVIIIAICLLFFLKIFTNSPTFSIIYDVCRLILMIFKFLAIFLLVILIEYNNFLILALNKELDKPRPDLFHVDINKRNLIRRIQNIKILQFESYKISTMINSQFGWFVMSIFLDNFNIITNGVLLFFMYTVNGSNGFLFFRKHFFFFFCEIWF